MTISPWKKQLPMLATYSRIVALVPIVVLMSFPSPMTNWLAMLIFVLASLTDWLDGYWARRYQAESSMGRLMDPVADKLLVLGPLVMLLYLSRLDPLMVILVLGRDIFIGGIRSVAALNQVIIAAKPFGKWKTGLQMVGLPCLMSGEEHLLGLPVGQIGYILLWLSVILSLVSGAQYTWGYYVERQKI